MGGECRTASLTFLGCGAGEQWSAESTGSGAPLRPWGLSFPVQQVKRFRPGKEAYALLLGCLPIADGT